MPASTGFPQQLAEFLAVVSSFHDEPAAVEGAVERAAEAVDAEVAACVRGERVLASIGFPCGAVPNDALVAAARGELTEIEVPGAGVCRVLVVPVDLDLDEVIVLARGGAPFSQEEASLLRAMGRVLALSLGMIRTIEGERELRRASEQQVDENARLLASVQDRQLLLERLFKIQRSISHRAPTQSVLDAIVEGAAELLGDEVVGLRLVDPEDPEWMQLVAIVGMGDDVVEAVRRTPIDQGVGGRAFAVGRLVTTEDYATSDQPIDALVTDGLHAAMAAPVYRNGEIVGSLAVASRDPSRRYSSLEEEALLAFAEHASLALNDASALDAMSQAFSAAVHKAHHDGLTGLPNRALALERLDEALRASGSGEVGVLFVDLDRFKMVNDSLGHSVGDEVLVAVANRLSSAVRPGDTVARLGGDEFVVLCEGVDGDVLDRVAQRILAAIREPITLYGRDAVLTASIGIARAGFGARADDVLRNADVAMYRAKERGRARTELFDEDMRTRILDQVETEQELRRSLLDDDLLLHYQPIVSVSTRSVLGFEALVRWQHPKRGLVLPDDFIAVAEDTGLILPMGAWVLTEACRQLASWREVSGHDALKVSVNLSPRQFSDPDLASVVSRALEEAGLPGDALVLELTESMLIDPPQAVATLRSLKDLGVQLSIDDFGTGYSSLSYLKRFPIDTLKIDRSFIEGVVDDVEDRAIVAAVVNVADALGLDVVAEGVESEEQLEVLRDLGCRSVQGYLFGRPQPASRVEV